MKKKILNISLVIAISAFAFLNISIATTSGDKSSNITLGAIDQVFAQVIQETGDCNQFRYFKFNYNCYDKYGRVIGTGVSCTSFIGCSNQGVSYCSPKSCS